MGSVELNFFVRFRLLAPAAAGAVAPPPPVRLRLFDFACSLPPQVVSRRQRLAVAVRAGAAGAVPGCIVLDASASGATQFVEPPEAVALNNEQAGQPWHNPSITLAGG